MKIPDDNRLPDDAHAMLGVYMCSREYRDLAERMDASKPKLGILTEEDGSQSIIMDVKGKRHHLLLTNCRSLGLALGITDRLGGGASASSGSRAEKPGPRRRQSWTPRAPIDTP